MEFFIVENFSLNLLEHIVSKTPYIIMGFICFCYNLTLDFKVDWNLLNIGSKNFLLRDQLSFRNWIYYLCIIADIILRLVWIISILNITLEKESWIFIASFLEIIRQIMWVILKVDNESYNNLEGHIDYLYVPKLPEKQRE